MAKLSWDQSGERRYETGVDHGVLYTEKATSTAAETKSFTKGTPWNGLISVTESPSGADANEIYADNMLYAVLRAAEKFGATIEAYTYPPEFAECDGSRINSGVKIGQQPRKMFGFSFRSDVGDDTDSSVDPNENYILHIIWNATASPSEKQYSSINESPEATTFSWELTTTPVSVDGYNPFSQVTIDTSTLTEAEKARLETLEGVLYGTTTTEPYLPTPDQVIGIMDGTVTIL